MSDAEPQTPRRHFHVDAVEMLLEDPQPCLFLPDLQLVGLAVTPAGQHHLILTLGTEDRIYFGPDDVTVARRAEILAAALRLGVRALEPFHAAAVANWVSLAWEAALDELAGALAAPALARL